jgi:hypothetical protein
LLKGEDLHPLAPDVFDGKRGRIAGQAGKPMTVDEDGPLGSRFDGLLVRIWPDADLGIELKGL